MAKVMYGSNLKFIVDQTPVLPISEKCAESYARLMKEWTDQLLAAFAIPKKYLASDYSDASTPEDKEQGILRMNVSISTSHIGQSIDIPIETFDTLREMRQKLGLCLECGHKGEWIAMALMCPDHGRICG